MPPVTHIAYFSDTPVLTPESREPTMTDLLPPPPSTPPPFEPPAGLAWGDAPAPEAKTSASTAAGVVNIICGAVMVLGVFLPAFELERGGDEAWWPMSQTPDSSFFLLIGLIIAVLGAVRLHRDQTGLCVAVAIVAVAGGLFAVTDASNLQTYYMENLHYNGYSMTYGPALFIIGMAALGAIGSVFLPKSENR